jgi:hypothetical protein
MTDEDVIKLLQIYCPDVPLERITNILYGVKEEFNKFMEEEELCPVNVVEQ